MNAMFLKLLNMSAAGSVLILAVVVLRAVLKKAPRWIICVMWALVAIRLVCPISLSSPVSAFRATPSLVSESGEVEVFRPAGGSEKPLLAVDTVQIERPQASAETIREIPGTSYAVTQRSRDAYLPPLVTAYLLGLSAMLLYALVSTLLLRKRVAVSLRQRGNIRICDEVAGPFILGILRPVIYLPSSLSEEERRFVLAHERAHLRRLDHVWKPLGFLILSVHWFNPFCWLAYVLLCRDIELACDEKVIRELGRDERAAYSQTLLNCSAHRILAACPVAFGETDVKARVKAVLNYKKPAFWIILAAVLGCLVLVACLMTKPSATKQLENAGHSETYDQNKFLPLYQNVLYKYRSVLINESFDDTYLMDSEVSELVEAFFGRDPLHRVGWALVDLDADFEPELVIGAVENEEMYGNILFGVYTLTDSKPVRLVQSSEPAHLYDLGDGMLLDEFSNSAEKHWILWRLNDGKLVFEDGLIYQSTWDDIEPWHQMECANDWEIVPGQTIGEGKATAWIQKYQSRINHLKFTAFDSIDWASLPTAQLPEQSALPTPVPPPEGSGLSGNAPAFVRADPEAFLLSFSSGKVIERIDYSEREYADSGKGFDEIISARTWTAHESRGFPASAPDRVVELLRDDFPQDPGWVLRFEESDGEMLCIAWQAYPFSDATWVLDCGENLMDELMTWAITPWSVATREDGGMLPQELTTEEAEPDGGRLLVTSGDITVEPYRIVRFAEIWTEDGQLSADGLPIELELEEHSDEIPVLRLNGELRVRMPEDTSALTFYLLDGLNGNQLISEKLYHGERLVSPVKVSVSQLGDLTPGRYLCYFVFLRACISNETEGLFDRLGDNCYFWLEIPER